MNERRHKSVLHCFTVPMVAMPNPLARLMREVNSDKPKENSIMTTVGLNELNAIRKEKAIPFQYGLQSYVLTWKKCTLALSSYASFPLTPTKLHIAKTTAPIAA